jgi:hypothetical protein
MLETFYSIQVVIPFFISDRWIRRVVKDIRSGPVSLDSQDSSLLVGLSQRP